MLDKIRELNNVFIDNDKEKDKHIIIKKIIDDDDCFFKMSMEEAYALLRELDLDEERIKKIYYELIDSSHFS